MLILFDPSILLLGCVILKRVVKTGLTEKAKPERGKGVSRADIAGRTSQAEHQMLR